MKEAFFGLSISDQTLQAQYVFVGMFWVLKTLL